MTPARRVQPPRTQVGTIGAGPAGLLLSRLLQLQGIDTVVLENRSRDHVEARIRAGILEQNTGKTLIDAGVRDRLQREGLPTTASTCSTRAPGTT